MKQMPQIHSEDGEIFAEAQNLLEQENESLEELISQTGDALSILSDLTPEEEQLIEQIRSMSADAQLYLFGALMSVGISMVSIWIALDDLSKGKLDASEAAFVFAFVVLSLFAFYKLNRGNENRRFKLTQLTDGLDAGAVEKILLSNKGDLLPPEQLERMKEKYEQGKVEEIES